MTIVTKKYAVRARQFNGVPYGNKTARVFTLATNAAGVFVDSDKATALAVGDVVRLGVLPAGMEIHNGTTVVSDAFTANSTGSVGFSYIDGVDSTDVPQDDTYFASALALDALARTPGKAVAPVTLPKDAYLIVTIGGAAENVVGRLDVVVDGILTGNP